MIGLLSGGRGAQDELDARLSFPGERDSLPSEETPDR
jgi:hypothetical protein